MTKVEIRMTNESNGGSGLAELFRDEVIQRNLSWTKGQQDEAGHEEGEGCGVDDEIDGITEAMDVALSFRKAVC